MHSKRNRNLAVIVLTVSALVLLSAVVFAEEVKFEGTWKSAVTPAAPAPAAPAGGRGGPGGAGGFGGGGGAQKITLRVKTSKDKAKGNFTMGSGDSGNTLDINNGKIEGNKMTFKTGLSGTQIYVYEATVEGDTMTLTRAPEAAAPGAAPAAPAGGRGGIGGGGGGGKQTFTLLRDKK